MRRIAVFDVPAETGGAHDLRRRRRWVPAGGSAQRRIPPGCAPAAEKCVPG